MVYFGGTMAMPLTYNSEYSTSGNHMFIPARSNNNPPNPPTSNTYAHPKSIHSKLYSMRIAGQFPTK